jgi:hypothetical protein
MLVRLGLALAAAVSAACPAQAQRAVPYCPQQATAFPVDTADPDNNLYRRWDTTFTAPTGSVHLTVLDAGHPAYPTYLLLSGPKHEIIDQIEIGHFDSLRVWTLARDTSMVLTYGELWSGGGAWQYGVIVVGVTRCWLYPLWVHGYREHFQATFSKPWRDYEDSATIVFLPHRHIHVDGTAVEGTSSETDSLTIDSPSCHYAEEWSWDDREAGFTLQAQQAEPNGCYLRE